MRRIIPARSLVVVLVLTVIGGPVYSQSKKSDPNDVLMELIGQTITPSANSSVQYGYASYINGVDTIFNGRPGDETKALFTFYNDTTNTQVLNTGPLRVVNRVGTATIYFNPSGGASFNDPNSFRIGTPVMVASLRMQLIVDTLNTPNTFTATFVLTVTDVNYFQLDDHNVHIGRIGQKLRLTFFGRFNATPPPATNIAGFVVGGDWR